MEPDEKLLRYDINNIGYGFLIDIFLGIFNKFAPLKKKYIRANQEKEIYKANIAVSDIRCTTIVSNYGKNVTQ